MCIVNDYGSPAAQASRPFTERDVASVYRTGGPRVEYDALTRRYESAARRLHVALSPRAARLAEQRAAVESFRRAARLDVARKRGASLMQAIARGFLARAALAATNAASTKITYALRRRHTARKVELRVAKKRAIEDQAAGRVDAARTLQRGWKRSRDKVEGRKILESRKEARKAEGVERARREKRLRSVLLVQRNFRRQRPARLFGVLLDAGPGDAAPGAVSGAVSYLLLRTMKRSVALSRAIDAMRDRLMTATALLTPDVPAALAAVQALAAVPTSGLWRLLEQDRNSLVSGVLAAVCLLLRRSPEGKVAGALLTKERAVFATAVASSAMPRVPPRALRAARRLVHGMHLRERLDAAAARQAHEDAGAVDVKHEDELDAMLALGGAGAGAAQAKGAGQAVAAAAAPAATPGAAAATPKAVAFSADSVPSMKSGPPLAAAAESPRSVTSKAPLRPRARADGGGAAAAMTTARMRVPTGDALAAARALAAWCEALLAAAPEGGRAGRGPEGGDSALAREESARLARKGLSSLGESMRAMHADDGFVKTPSLTGGAGDASPEHTATIESGSEMGAKGSHDKLLRAIHWSTVDAAAGAAASPRSAAPSDLGTPLAGASTSPTAASGDGGIEGVLFSPTARPLMGMSGVRLAHAVARGVDAITSHESAASREAQEPEAVALSLHDAIDFLRVLGPMDADAVRAIVKPPAPYLGLAAAVRACARQLLMQ